MKYADDTAIIGLISNDNDKDYLDCVDFVNLWCRQNYLDLNVSKTKEVLWDFRKNRVTPEFVKVDDLSVECVDSYKYLGVWIDNEFKFKKHVDAQIKKANKRVYCLRSMKQLKVSPDIMALFYNATIASVIMYACAAFYALLTKQNCNVLHKPLRVSRRLLGSDKLCTNEQLYNLQLSQLTSNIVNDISHPLHDNFVMLPSGRRYRMPKIRTNRFKNSFVPRAIAMVNA
jgi:hypothetical protein